MPSPSASPFGPATKGQRSVGQKFGNPGLPSPSPSLSSWPGLNAAGQLSGVPQMLLTPSLSGSGGDPGGTGHGFERTSRPLMSSAGVRPSTPAGTEIVGGGPENMF